MSTIRNIRGFGSFVRAVMLTMVVGATSLVASPALAQKKDAEPEKPPKSYTLPYFFSGLGVLMIVVPLCFPSVRKTEAPKDEDD